MALVFVMVLERKYLETDAVCFCILNPVCEIKLLSLTAQNGQKTPGTKTSLNLMYVLRKALETLISGERMARSDTCCEVCTDKMQDGWWCLKSKQDLGFHFEYLKVRSTAYCINGDYSSIK